MDIRTHAQSFMSLTLGTPMNKEESKLNVKPKEEKYLNMRYLQLSSAKEIKGGLFAFQFAR